ncbi:gamma-glutamylcyclotransferase isoform X2 [Macaca nemestrina]|uniref:gamma-glutamylcyclotransferase n=1 Tax=Macaca nemestrina TaxID=9545 RepID=A0A2K6BH46_MACNE|nr:gamma-glutamylcyclotransferase isoform X2 [Macaca nemestrina]
MANSGCKDVPGPDEESFLYFAYGSNLLTERIHLRNPSAAFFCVARLQDFKLDFGNSQGKTSQTWHGGIATIFQSPGDEVWGVVWKMNKSNLNSLDEWRKKHHTAFQNQGNHPCKHKTRMWDRDPNIPVQNPSLAVCWQAQSGHGTCNRLYAWVQKKMVCRWSIKRS